MKGYTLLRWAFLWGNSHRTGNPAANLKSASNCRRIKCFYQVLQKWKRSSWQKRQIQIYNTLLIHTDGSFTTGLYCSNPWKQKMTLTLLLLDNNVHFCSIYLWDTHIALRLSCKDKWDTDNKSVKHVSSKHWLDQHNNITTAYCQTDGGIL